MKNFLILVSFVFLSISALSQEVDTLETSNKTNIDTVKFKSNVWILDNSNDLKYYEIDTILDEFQLFAPNTKQSFLNFTKSGILSPCYPAVNKDINLIFNDNFFSSFYNNYLIKPEEIIYYQTNKPYTDIFYSTSRKIKEEQQLNLIHSQTLNSKLNFGLKYNLVTSKDTLNELGNSSSNSLAIWSSFTDKRYSLHTNLIYNKLKIIETGGIIDTAKDFNYEEIEYFINNSGTILSDNYLYINQEYKLGKTEVEMINDSTFLEHFNEKSAISHILKIEKSYHKFSESKINDSYFQNNFINNEKTNDSTSFLKISNLLQIKSKKYEIFGIELNGKIAVQNDLYKIYNFKDYFQILKSNYKTSTYVVSGINNFKIKSFSANANLKYCLFGYNLADLELNTDFQKKFYLKNDTLSFIINVDYQHKEPTFFIQNFFSNHISWNNDFKKQKIISLNFNVLKPNHFIDLQFTTKAINDYVYFDENSVPKQYEGLLNISSIFLSKKLNLGKFKMINKIVYQNVTKKDILSLPDLVIFNSTYLDTEVFQKALKIQLGFDIYYTSTYKMYSINPALSTFYLSSYESGNYPIINPFFKMKLKTSLIFFQMEHANANLLENYFSYVAHYHLADYFFRFGVKWWFFN